MQTLHKIKQAVIEEHGKGIYRRVTEFDRRVSGGKLSQEVPELRAKWCEVLETIDLLLDGKVLPPQSQMLEEVDEELYK